MNHESSLEAKEVEKGELKKLQAKGVEMDELEECQIFEIFPYFIWEVNDIDSLQTFSSPIFTVDGVNFKMFYHSNYVFAGKTSILLKPLIESSMVIQPKYTINASISVMRPDKKREDLRFTQKTLLTNTNIKDNGFHTIWKMEREDLLFYRDKLVDVENEMTSVTFLCVFGQLSEYQKNDAMDDDTWCEEKCFVQLGLDINNLRLKADSTIVVLNCGKYKTKANLEILSVRSENFYSMILKHMVDGEVEILDMDFNVLDNIITYIHSGQLRDSYLPDALLKQVYKFASEYEIDQLQKMVSFKLLERMNKSYFFCSCSSACKDVLCRSERILSHTQFTSDDYENTAHVVEKDMFFTIPYFDCLENISNRILDLLLVVNKYKDTEFKENLIFSIAMKNSFVLHSERWKTFVTERPLSMEICDAFVMYNMRVQE